MADQLHKLTLIEAAKAAGAEIRQANPDTEDVIEKTNPADVVTSTDIAAQKALADTIWHNFPNDIIVAEEMPERLELLQPSIVHTFTGWVADPLDGTNGFRFRADASCVSIGYIESGAPVMGVVYDPFRDELFYAERGGGAYLNDTQIHIRASSVLGAATRIVTGSSYDPAQTKLHLTYLRALDPTPWLLFRDSAVLGMADVAAGRADLFFHTTLKPWDNAAAFLLVTEAGGVVTDMSGRAEAGFTSSHAVLGANDLVEAFVKATHSANDILKV